MPCQGQTLAEKRLIRDRIKRSFLQNHDNALLVQVSRLPEILCEYIAEYLVLPFIAATTLEAQLGRPQSLQVKTDAPIWAQFIKFHGKVFVASLSNTEYENSGKTSTSTLIYSPSKHRRADVIHVAYDPWGIRNILFASKKTKINTCVRSGVWWHTLTLEPGLNDLDADGDVSDDPMIISCT